MSDEPKGRWKDGVDRPGAVAREAGGAAGASGAPPAPEAGVAAGTHAAESHASASLPAPAHGFAAADAHLAMVCEMLETRLPGSRCAVLRLEGEPAVLRYAASPSLPRRFRDATDGLPLDPAASPVAAAILRDEPVVLDDLADGPADGPADAPPDRSYRDAALAAGLRACWVLPLRLADGGPSGALCVHHERPLRPGDVELDATRTAASLAELALGHGVEAAALRESERHSRRMSEFRRTVMKLVELALDEGAQGSFDQRLLEEAVRVIPGAATGSILKRAGDGAFRFVAAVGFDLERLRTVRMPSEAVAFGHASEDHHPLVVRDPDAHAALDDPDADTLRSEGRLEELRSVLSVPIVVDGAMDAYMTLDNYDDPDAFDEDAIEMARIFAGQVASLMKRFELERSLYLQAYQDSLTGLPNRAAFKQRLQERLDAGRTWAGHAVLFVDLDNLKPINDSLGHPAGDVVLREVAERIRGTVKDGAGFVARLGGDEFTVLLSGPRIREDAAATARRIIEALTAPIHVEAYDVRVGASIGISLCPEDGSTVTDLLRHADIAMYHAKKSGKGTYRYFADEMEAGARQRVMLEGALREALAKDEFEVHYQPRVSLRDGRIVAAEALVRWNHPEWGLVPPGRFVSLAEATNLIHPLGRRVLELACREAVGWPGRGAAPPRVSVNVSRHQLQRADIVDEVAEALAGSGLAPDRLELEILETSAMTDVTESARTLAQLRELGVRISLDDFGTGHSSLGWLQNLPVDVLKLDRTFVARLGDEALAPTSGADDVAILGAILRLGQALGLTVVAEGVEREAQLALLRQLGCAEAQGYLFSRPLPAAELAPLLRRGEIPLPAVP